MEENPDEVLDDKTEAVIRELEGQHKEARKLVPSAGSRVPRCAAG